MLLHFNEICLCPSQEGYLLAVVESPVMAVNKSVWLVHYPIFLHIFQDVDEFFGYFHLDEVQTFPHDR